MMIIIVIIFVIIIIIVCFSQQKKTMSKRAQSHKTCATICSSDQMFRFCFKRIRFAHLVHFGGFRFNSSVFIWIPFDSGSSALLSFHPVCFRFVLLLICLPCRPPILRASTVFDIVSSCSISFRWQCFCFHSVAFVSHHPLSHHRAFEKASQLQEWVLLQEEV